MVVCNTTLENEYIVEEPLWGNVTFHTLGLGISATFGLISIIISLYLIMQHALHYLKPNEQKYIMRILVMVPIYSFVSCLSYLYYRETVYFQVIRDCYEAFAIASFFTLLCSYIAPSLHDQKDYFRTISVKNWLLGVFWMQKCTGGEHKGPFRKPRSGLTWFNVRVALSNYHRNCHVSSLVSNVHRSSFGSVSSNTASSVSFSPSYPSSPKQPACTAWIPTTRLSPISGWKLSRPPLCRSLCSWSFSSISSSRIPCPNTNHS